MIRFLASGALILLGTYPAFAQSYCDQVRQGIEQYGYASAKRYAAQHYSPEELRAVDRCLAKMRMGGQPQPHHPNYHYHHYHHYHHYYHYHHHHY